LILNSQIEIRVVTRTFSQGTFELTHTEKYHSIIKKIDYSIYFSSFK